MTDRDLTDALAWWLAYAHPAFMVATLVLVGITLRSGLQLRSGRRARTRGRRRAGAPPRGQTRKRHLRFAKPAVVLVLLGSVTGPISSTLLRGWDFLGSFHGVVGGVVIALYATAGILGLRLERVQSQDRETHGVVGLLAGLLSGLAAIAGFILLP